MNRREFLLALGLLPAATEALAQSKCENPFTKVADTYDRRVNASTIGMTTHFHLTHHHGYTPVELNGLTEQQLRNLHSLEHDHRVVK